MAEMFNCNGVMTPKPTTTELRADKIRETFKLLGSENFARVGQNPFKNAIKEEIRESGYSESRGPRPWCEEGAGAPGDGSGRLMALAELASESPDLFGKIKVKIDVYPPLTEEQRLALITRASKSTAPFTEKDYYKLSMRRWQSHPGESQLEHLRGMGLEFAMLFFKPAPESAMERIKNSKGETTSIRLKPGVVSDDLWGKGKGGQKQGPVQVGAYLAQAHPRAVQAFFDGWGDDKEHSISYRELIETVTQWNEDKKLYPKFAAPPADFTVLVKECPESALVKGVLGARLAHGKVVQGGRDAGKGRMDQKASSALATTLGAVSEVGPMILARHERTAGHTSEEGLRDLEAVLRADKSTRDLNLEPVLAFIKGHKAPEELIATVQAVIDNQKLARAAIGRTHARAAAEAEAERKAIQDAEAKKKSNEKK